MDIPTTHRKVNQRLCGSPIELRTSFAKLDLQTSEDMIVDETGLIHGGFIFGLADYCAMLTVNHPNVVLAKAEVTFLKPVRLNDYLIATGSIANIKEREIEVIVEIHRNDDLVFSGMFQCFTPKIHILKRNH
ncbi:MAG: hotdog domain-containing protein [Promethearchaeota archaeon]